MKTQAVSNVLLAAVAGLATTAQAAIQLEVRFSDKMIEVGNLDLKQVTRDAIYAESGNTRGVVTDRNFGTVTNTCQSAVETDPDLTVQVKMNGAWGKTPGLGGNEMRDGLIAGIFEVLTQVSGDTGYEIFTDCRGLSWNEAVSYTKDAACGRLAARSCEQFCSNENSPGLAQCMKQSWGHKVPSSMRVTAYINDTLQADDLTIEFASTENEKSGGCGIIGKIAAGLASFAIPVAGGLFAQGINLACSS